jgi:hypothetical protein
MFPMLLAIGKKMPIVGDLLSAIFDRLEDNSYKQDDGRASATRRPTRGDSYREDEDNMF